MFKLNGDVLEVKLPKGKKQSEILKIAELEFPALERQVYGLDLKVNGRITTSLAMSLGHELAHICKTISMFNPSENEYVLVIKH